MQCGFFHTTDVGNFSDRHFTNEVKHLLQYWSHISLSVWLVYVRANLRYHSVRTYACTAGKFGGIVDPHSNIVSQLLSSLIVVNIIFLQKVSDVHVDLVETHRCKIGVVL